MKLRGLYGIPEDYTEFPEDYTEFSRGLYGIPEDYTESPRTIRIFSNKTFPIVEENLILGMHYLTTEIFRTMEKIYTQFPVQNVMKSQTFKVLLQLSNYF